jgi:hypothetical protein
VEFGKNSFISRAARVQAEGPLGQPRLDSFQKFLGDTTEAFDNKLSGIAGGGVPLSRVDAGVHLRQAAERAVDDLFQTVGDTTYNKIVTDYPGLRLSNDAQQMIASKLNGIEKFAKGKFARGLTDVDKSQARGLINAVNAIRNTNGSVKQAVEELQAIGKAAYQPRNTLAAIPPDIEKLRDLYNTLREGVVSTVKTDVQNGEELAGALQISNDLMTEFFGNQNKIGEILGNPKLAPEQVFDRLTKNTEQIAALKNLLRPEDFAPIKGAFIEGLVKRDELGNISWKQFKNSLQNRANQAVVSAVLEPAELKELLDIARLGERAGIPIMSTSGTGASNSILGTIKDMPFRMAGESLIDLQKAKARGLILPGGGNSGLRLPLNTINTQIGGNYAGSSRGFGGGAFGETFSPEALRSQPTRLKGLPDTSAGPNPAIADAASAYAKQAGIKYSPPTEYAKVNPDRGARIARAYEEMKHAPNDPKVKRAYDALAKETLDQYETIKKLGIKIEPIKPGMPNPYPDGPKQVHEDIKNGHLWFFPSDAGFGSSGLDVSDNPLLKLTGETIDGVQLRVNDVFRIVHDIFGHAKTGVGFGPRGEENAWLAHMRMYSPEAQKAMTSETRGQNSWVNFGPHGESNRANQMNTIYADQKTGLLPDWVMKEMDKAERGPARIGPSTISAKEALGLRLPQQISIKEQNKKKDR